ncbi:class I adenylate-forming enzyme family protein [Saccharothrix australiensis]|uniref:Acyl-CoA synthetase (AMP-forming)/AMP-acid ligase II n=1 Tax=Saccharothrix australiensis TaxID=2072 RepID=A0A495W486_9PSEU|nr:class I adenylate-forming enzyme family protein [Saccharothrix australiensis]RKT56462.1 acyl-CoA synthetase (AMP-forming)/AMP-acid ligase II [Saccharothrix australiensis]
MRDYVTELLRRHGDDVPLFSHHHTVTHGDLRASVAAEAALFAAAGVGADSNVAVQVPPSFTQLEVVLALWTLGARVVSFDHRFTRAEREVEHALARPQFVVRATGHVGGAFRERYELVTERRPDGVPATTRHRLVQFSSGSTGTPKIIGRDTASLVREVERFAAAEGMVRGGERLLLLNNTAYSFGLVGGLLHSLAQGVHLVFPRQGTAADVLRAAAAHEVHFITGQPFHFARLAEHPDRAALRTVRAAFSGAELMPPEVADRFASAYGFRVGECFGTTETGALTLDVAGTTRPAVGRPLGDTRLRVRDGLVEVALEDSPYLRDDGVVRYADGWFRTGDRGELDARGNLRLLGRSDSLVIVRGQMVDLTEVEAALRRHPRVAEAIAVYDGRVEVYVGAESDTLSTEDVARWCRELLVEYKHPQRIHVLRTLPRTANGKLLRDPKALAAAR